LISLTGRGLDLINEAVPAITRYETEVVTNAVASRRDRTAVESGLRQMLIAQEAVSAETP
jgi:hypothetical protein